jgi:hypothetical protein
VVATLEGTDDAVSTIKLGDPMSDVGNELAGVVTALLSTVKTSPHDEVVGAAGRRLSVDVPAAGATEKGSPQDDVCAEEMPSRERKVVFRRED